MPYHFLFGASGAGKSSLLHRSVLKAADKALKNFSNENFLFLVPEQYTMQTQKDLVLASPSGGILNVDVLSFGRLAHRIFEESGGNSRAVLNDLGKSLILQRLAEKLADRLPVIGGNLHRQGYIAEVKSILSEFMQYDLSVEDVGRLADFAGDRGGLRARLLDLQAMYQAFLDYEQEKFVTSEETLDLVAEAVPDSPLVRNSVIIFDGFTGFTPVQNRVILALMKSAKDVVISLTLSEDGGKPASLVEEEKDAGEEQSLFYLTRKTVASLSRLAAEEGIPHEEDIFLQGEPWRFRGNPPLAHLERQIFRYPQQPYTVPEREPMAGTKAQSAARQGAGAETADSFAVSIFEASTRREEVRQVCIRMKRLAADEGYSWRDFAVVAGDLPGYEDLIRQAAALYHIPVYIDLTRQVLHNPLTETIRAALEIRLNDFSYETVFRYLRAGLSDLKPEETDLLENYCLARGIRGRKRWMTSFDAVYEEMREKVMESLDPLLQDEAGRRLTAAERTEALYDFLVKNRMQEKMESAAADFEEQGDSVRASEYRQVYRAVIDLLSQIHDLLAEEPISRKDYLELIRTGIGEIRLGTLPQQADTVLAGDLERSRLTQVKVLFVLGANDGCIPKGASTGGILSDFDREFLASSGIELSPTPRDQMYIQRLYLYLNLTKPSDRLIVSFADADEGGTALRPSYLIPLLTGLFPQTLRNGSIRKPEELPAAGQLTGEEDTIPYLAEALRLSAEGHFEAGGEDEARTEFLTVYGLSAGLGTDTLRAAAVRLRRAAFLRYEPRPLSSRAVRRLYGSTLSGSVSRLEQTAECYRRQFLQYGMRLMERPEFVLQPADAGSVLHESLWAFSQELRKRGLTWRTFGQDEGRSMASEAVRLTAETYGGRILHADAAGEYRIRRMQRILARTVDTLKAQIEAGDFDPEGYELTFGTGDPDTPPGLVLDLGNGRMYLNGRIDRLDLARKDSGIYVKIIDYKSGTKDLSPVKMLDGRQLQLMVYMEEVLRWLREKYPERNVSPAALFYYHLADPYRKVLPGEEMPAPIDGLKPKGMLSADPVVIDMLDHDLEGGGTSSVIPVRMKKDGTPCASPRLFTDASYTQLRDGLWDVCIRLGQQILAGNITAQPFVSGQDNACTWCPYRDVCGFDPRIPGYSTKSSN